MKKVARRFVLAVLLAQTVVWSLVQAAEPEAPRSKVILRITGLVDKADSSGAVLLDEAALSALPEHSFTTTAPWFKSKTTFTGPYLSDLLAAVGAKGTQLTIRALNDYKVQVPVSDAYKFGPIVARKVNDKIISVRDKGPLFLIYPFDSNAELNTEIYFSRSIWQIKSIHIE